MSEIALRNVCKQFDSEHYGVKDFNLDIHDKEFVIFVGPSGCGKSTTLRIIAGLEEITDGELWIDGEFSNYLEPKERGMSMVFQNYALYPNMTVYGNMAYALKIRKLPKDEIDRKVHEVAKILEIEQLLDRKPAALSGGQKQRVAIGSAIIRKPKAFLMDEPLSNLDAKLRAQMRVELVKLHKQLDTTIIYVTHDQTEAMTLGTKIVVMKDGLIQQVGAPQSIYDNPVNLFVAGFLGSPSMNFFRCTVKAEENNRTALLLDDAKTVKKVYLDGTRGKQIADRYNGRQVILGIRPEDIYIFEPSDAAQLTGTVTSSIFKGVHYEMLVQTREGYELMVQDYHCFEAGREVGLLVKPFDIHVMKKERTCNTFEGKLLDETHVEFLGCSFECSPVQGIGLEMPVTVEVDFQNVILEDNEEDGRLTGEVKFILYKGNHYHLTVFTDWDEDIFVDTSDVWDDGDRVGIRIAPENIRVIKR